MLQHAREIVFVTMIGSALLLAGCGGGGTGDGPEDVGTAEVSGIVYAPGEVQAAQAGGGGQAVPNCPVEVNTEPGGQRLASGQTDGAGRYRFHGLRAGETVVVEADVPGVGPLMTRVRLRDGSCNADVTEGTTLAAVCARYAYGQGSGPGEQQLAGEIAEECLQYQAQNGYRYRQGQAAGPNFGDPEDVEDAANELLAAAAQGALEQARTSRAQGDCERAVQMIRAQLQARNQSQLQLTEQLMEQLATCMRRGSVSEEQVAQAMSQVMNRQVTAAQVRSALQYWWQQMGTGDQDRDPEVIEAVAAMIMPGGDGQMVRLQTQAQVQAMVQALCE